MNDNSHTTTNSSFPPSDWVETTLGEVCEIKTESINPKESATFFNVYSLPGFDNNKLPERLKSDEIKSNKYILKEKCILFSKLNPKTSRVWRVESVLNKNICSTEFIPLVVKDNIVNNFFYYFLNSPFVVNTLGKSAGGTSSSHQRIRPNQLLDLPIFLPPLLEQQAISSVLSSFDDKIQLLQEQNKILEEMGRVIFKEWFGKYSIDDELPKGWKIGKLGEEFNITIGRTPPRAESQWFSYTPIGKKWISIKDIGNSGTYIFDTSEYLTDEAINKFNIPLIPENTTILSFKMTVGKLTITTEKMLSNEAIAHFKLKKDSVLSSEYIYSYLQKLDFNALGSTSSIVTAINSTMIKNLEIIIPNQEILKQFDEAIQPIFRKIRNNSEQIQSLARSRDELLPKLMSGQVRVNS